MLLAGIAPEDHAGLYLSSFTPAMKNALCHQPVPDRPIKRRLGESFNLLKIKEGLTMVSISGQIRTIMNTSQRDIGRSVITLSILSIRVNRQHFYVKRQIPLIYDIRVQQVERKSYSGHQFPVDKISHVDCLNQGYMD